jgi:hypothetical protein
MALSLRCPAIRTSARLVLLAASFTTTLFLAFALLLTLAFVRFDSTRRFADFAATKGSLLARALPLGLLGFCSRRLAFPLLGLSGLTLPHREQSSESDVLISAIDLLGTVGQDLFALDFREGENLLLVLFRVV